MTVDVDASFGAWVRARRKALDITQFDLAERVDCAESTIQRIEANERRPSKQVAALLAEALAVPLATRPDFLLFARTGTPMPGLARDEPPGSAAPTAGTSNVDTLPLPLTPLIGRQAELATASALLQEGQARLLVLTGPPGVGKTRLALALAWELAPTFADGVYFVSLATLRDPTLLLDRVAHALALSDNASEPKSTRLQNYLHDKRLLLVLDNFEQIVSAASLLTEWLGGAPHLQVLITSRAGLRVRGERRFPVRPLSLPPSQRISTLSELLLYPAVALFVDRAQAVDPGFALTSANAGAVAAICARLDGLPLAIELAAARSARLTAEAVQARLGGRLGLGEGTGADLPIHQQTLRAAIAWSYELLSPGEQQLLMRMGVFAGGATLDAIEAVCDAHCDLAGGAAPALEGLLEQSLAYRDVITGASPHFSMLQTIREFASEELAARGEEEEISRMHAEYFLALTAAAAPHLEGAQQAEWLSRLEAEHDNLRAALAWARTRGANDPTAVVLGARLAGYLGRFWEIRSYFEEGRQHLAEVVAALARAAIEPAARATHQAAALSAAGTLAYRQADYASARALHEESLALRRRLGDGEGIAASLNHLGTLIYIEGETVAARALLEESLALRRELGDKPGIAQSLTILGVVADRRGDDEAARALHEEALVLQRDLGDQWGAARSLSNLGHVAYTQGDYPGARLLFEQSLGLRRELGDRWGTVRSLQFLGMVAFTGGDCAAAGALHEESLVLARELADKAGVSTALCKLGHIAYMQGDYVSARALYEESLALRREAGDQWGIANGLGALGSAAVALDQVIPGVRLLAASNAQRRALGVVLELDDGIPYEKALAAARARVDNDTFARAWQEGESMAVQEALALGAVVLRAVSQQQ